MPLNISLKSILQSSCQSVRSLWTTFFLSIQYKKQKESLSVQLNQFTKMNPTSIVACTSKDIHKMHFCIPLYCFSIVFFMWTCARWTCLTIVLESHVASCTAKTLYFVKLSKFTIKYWLKNNYPQTKRCIVVIIA